MLGKQFEMLSSQYQQGFKIRADYLRLKTQVQQAEIDSITGPKTRFFNRTRNYVSSWASI